MSGVVFRELSKILRTSIKIQNRVAASVTSKSISTNFFTGKTTTTNRLNFGTSNENIIQTRKMTSSAQMTFSPNFIFRQVSFYRNMAKSMY